MQGLDENIVRCYSEAHVKGKVNLRVFMTVVLLLKVPVVVLVVQIRPDEPSNIPSLSAVEMSHASPQSVCAKDDAPKNMCSMSVTLGTSHFEMSTLNDVARMNIKAMSVTLDTSQFEMSLLNDVARMNM